MMVMVVQKTGALIVGGTTTTEKTEVIIKEEDLDSMTTMKPELLKCNKVAVKVKFWKKRVPHQKLKQKLEQDTTRMAQLMVRALGKRIGMKNQLYLCIKRKKKRV